MISPAPALSPEQLEQIHEALRRTLKRLERNMAVNGNGRPPDLDQSAVGRLSRIEALQNQGLTRNLEERERVQLAQVMEAIARLENGSYGLCTSCRAPIEFERLVVFPEAARCCGCSGGT